MTYPIQKPYQKSATATIVAGTTGTASLSVDSDTYLKSLDITTNATITAVRLDGVAITPVANTYDFVQLFGDNVSVLLVEVDVDNSAGTVDEPVNVFVNGIHKL